MRLICLLITLLLSLGIPVASAQELGWTWHISEDHSPELKSGGRDWLLKQGITLESSAVVTVSFTGKILSVRTTEENAQAIDRMIKPYQIEAPSGSFERAEKWVIPEMVFKEAPFQEVILFIQDQSMKLDPDKKGLTIVAHEPPDKDHSRITTNYTNIPVTNALEQVSHSALMRLRISDDAVFVIDAQSPFERDELFICEVQVKASFFGDKGKTAFTPKEFLEAAGLTFPKGTSANYNEKTGILTVINSLETLELMFKTCSL